MSDAQNGGLDRQVIYCDLKTSGAAINQTRSRRAKSLFNYLGYAFISMYIEFIFCLNPHINGFFSFVLMLDGPFYAACFSVTLQKIDYTVNKKC